MKTLEGQMAINYLSRLTTILAQEKRDIDKNFQGTLLFTLLRLEKAYFEDSLPREDNNGPQLPITASGFPLLSTTFVHANLALESCDATATEQKRLAATWLEAIASLSEEKLETAKNLISQSKNRNKVPRIVNDLTSDQINFLKNLYPRSPREAKLPFTVSDSRPGVLLAQGATNPFTPRSDTQYSPNQFTARKYIDSEANLPEVSLGTKSAPIDPDRPPKHQRVPVLLTGYFVENQPIRDVQISSQKILAHTKNGLEEITPETALSLQNEFRLSPDAIAEAFLSLDLTSLDQDQTDKIIETFKTIKNLSNWTSLTGSNLSANYAASDLLLESADRLMETLKNVTDVSIRQAFQLALKKELQPIMSKLGFPEEPRARAVKPVRNPKRNLLSNILNRRN